MILSKPSSSTDVSVQSSTFPVLPTLTLSWIIAGWALMMLFLGLVTFAFPCIDVQERDLNTALITYMTMLILELGIWIPMCTLISPPDEGHLKKTKLVLEVSFVIFNQVSKISEQVISSINHLNYGGWVTFINIFCGVVSFLIVSALLWLIIDVNKSFCLKWEVISLACKAVLSATLVNISVFQLIVNKKFLHFPLFAILKGVIEMIDSLIEKVHKKDSPVAELGGARGGLRPPITDSNPEV